MSKLEKIQKDILSLTAEERELVGIFIKDAQSSIESGYHEAWQNELQKRLSEIQGNTKPTLQGIKSVVADIRNKISK